MKGLKNGSHYINISIISVNSSRPYMLNFFVLDPVRTEGDVGKHENHLGELVGGVVGGILLVILLCGATIAFRRRRSMRLKVKGSKGLEEDAASICTTCRCHRVDPFEGGPAPGSLVGQYDQQAMAYATGNLKTTPESPTEEVRSPAIFSVNNPDRVSMITRATQGSRESATAPPLPPLAFRTNFTRPANTLDMGASKFQCNSGTVNDEGVGDDGDKGGSRWSRRASLASSKTLVLD